MQWNENLARHFRKLRSYSLDQAEIYRQKANFWRVMSIAGKAAPAGIGIIFGYLNNYRKNNKEECGNNSEYHGYLTLTSTILLVVVSLYTIYQKAGERRQMLLNGAEMYSLAGGRIEVELTLYQLNRTPSSPEVLLNTMVDFIKTTDQKLLEDHYVHPSKFHAQIATTLRVLGARDVDALLEIMCPDGDQQCIDERTLDIRAVADVVEEGMPATLNSPVQSEENEV